MTESARRVLFVLLLVGTAAGVLRAAWPAPSLGPPHPAVKCAIVVEEPGVGVRCGDGDGREPGDVVGGGRMAPARLELFAVPLDLNRASTAELESLPGVGPHLAAAIVRGRPFRSVEDLERVRGVGRRRRRQLAPRLFVR